MNRRAFGLIEVLIVIGVLGAVTTLSIPLYNEYQIRSDLELATQQTTQGLDRARLLSQSAERDSSWGFYVPSGTLYKGDSYAERDTAFDEVFAMPSTIAVSGLFDVAFSKVEGLPSETGDIVLRALNNDERVIQVSIAVEPEQLATNQTDTLTICHYDGLGNATTITVPDSTWPSHQANGDTIGACPGASSSSSVASSVASSSSSSAASSVASSSSSSSAGGGGGGGSSSSTCAKFTYTPSTGKIDMQASATMTITNKLSQITFGAGGPTVPVHVCYSTNDGSSWSGAFGGNGNCSGNGNAYGNAVKPGGTDTKTVSLTSSHNVALKITGRYKQGGWLAFFASYTTRDNSGHALLMKNGDTISNYPQFGNQTNLKNYLVGQGLANSSGQITIGSCQLLSVTELGDLGVSAADFQDNVALLNFQ